VFPLLAHAESIEEKRERASAEKWLESTATSFNNACGAKIPTTGIIDWESWKTASDDKNHHAYTVCQGILSGGQSTCSDKIAKETVVKDIKKIVCKFELQDGTLTAHTHFLEDKPNARTKAWLQKNLP
jgi:hypothetical protein